MSAIGKLVAVNSIEHQSLGLQGRERVKMFFKIVYAAFPDFHTTIDQMVSGGNKVVVFTTTNETQEGPFMGFPPSGKHVSFKTADIYRIENGQMVEHWGITDSLQLLRDIGAIRFNQPAATPGSSPLS